MIYSENRSPLFGIKLSLPEAEPEGSDPDRRAAVVAPVVRIRIAVRTIRVITAVIGVGSAAPIAADIVAPIVSHLGGSGRGLSHVELFLNGHRLSGLRAGHHGQHRRRGKS